MRLDWIFLPKENPCGKFYIIIIIIIKAVVIIIVIVIIFLDWYLSFSKCLRLVKSFYKSQGRMRACTQTNAVET